MKKKSSIFQLINQGFKTLVFNQFHIRPYYNTDRLIVLMKRRIAQSSSSIKMVAGEYTHRVYDDPGIKEEILRAIEERNVEFELIGGPEFDEKSSFLYGLIKNKKIKYWKLPARPIRHFRIFDSKFVGIEEPHEKGSYFRDGYFIYSPSVGNELEKGFNQLKEKAIFLNDDGESIKVNVENIKENVHDIEEKVENIKEKAENIKEKAITIDKLSEEK
jgi:hypothetical protein